MRPLALAVALVTAGCALQPYQPRPLDGTEPAALFRAHDLADPGLRAFLERNAHAPAAWPAPRWDLSGLTLAAFYFHPQLRVAQARQAVQRAARISAGQAANPVLSVPWEHHSDEEPDQSGPWSIGMALEVLLERRGKRAARQARAAAEAEAAALDLQAVAWQVRGAVRQAFVDLAAARQAQTQAQRRAQAADEAVRLLERRLALGATSAFEVGAQRLERRRLQLAAHAARAAVADTTAALARAVGLHPHALDGVELDASALQTLPAVAALDGDALQAQALTARADLLAMLRRYAAAEAALHLEIERQYPDLRLSPGYLFDQGDNVWSLGASLVLPLLNRNEGPIAEAEARRSEAAARVQALQFEIVTALRRAIGRYAAEAEAEAAARALAAEAQARADQVARQLALGHTDRLDLVRSRLEAAGAAAALAEARHRRQAALGRLEDALGRPLGNGTVVAPMLSGRAP